MSQNPMSQEQAIIGLLGTTLASACAQPAILLIFPSWNGPSRAVVLLGCMVVFAILVHKSPSITWGSSKHALSHSAAFVIRHRFSLLTVATFVIVAQSIWPPSWRPFSAAPPRLVLVYPANSRAPTEMSSSNVHWVHWAGSLDPAIGNAPAQDFQRFRNVEDVSVFFLHFDVPVDCDDLTLTMADHSVVRHETTIRKDDRTALIVLHGRVRQDVEMTIEPAPPSAHRV